MLDYWEWFFFQHIEKQVDDDQARESPGVFFIKK